MKSYTLGLFYLLLLLIISCKENKDPNIATSNSSETNNKETSAVFERIEASYSQIEFRNEIKENLSSPDNLFDFDYFYNGAGVGVEDLNNDGLLDVVFCGNQSGNKIFLNKGAMVFEDITENSNINQGKNWSNGITFVDINGDGWMDFYISQGGPKQREQRKNLLFINQKDGTFSEQAENYGLADMGISTQSAFFDMDNDGDLDCIVMNENELYGVDPINLYRIIENNPETAYFNSSHLYRNDNGVFTDITKVAGLERPIFGLGLMVSDINSDGSLDIYIASDYYIPDALFINNGDNTFTDKIADYTNHISYYGMGIDIADINNDALQDIFVLDMASSDHYRSKTLMASMNTSRFNYLVNTAGFHYQYMYNSLQLNIGNNKYNNIAQLTETANTDWSWSVLMSDFDLDESKDIYVTNGYRRYALDNDLQMRVFEAKQRYKNQVPLQVKKDLYNSMPSEKLSNILYRNNGDLNFSNVAEDWGLGDFSFSNGAAMGDLDNDGDLDLVVNNMDDNAFLYKNLSREKELGNYLKVNIQDRRHSEPFVKVTLRYNGKTQLVETKRVRGYMSAHENSAHFGLGKEEVIDTLRVDWLDGHYIEKYNIAANTQVVIDRKEAKPLSSTSKKLETLFKPLNLNTLHIDFKHKENVYDDFSNEVLLPYKQSNLGPFIAKGDVNGDNKTDIYLGGASGQPGQMYIQKGKSFVKANIEAFKNDLAYEDMESIFFDFEGDGDQDLYVVSGGNEFDEFSSLYADRIYLNDGKGNFSKYQSSVLERFPKSGKSVAILDFDQDGDNDILVGNRIVPKNYPKHTPSVIYENKDGVLEDVTSSIAPELMTFGIVNKLIATDFDNDGREDFIAVGEWSSIGFFKNDNGTFRQIMDKENILNEKGWWYSITETDVNNDGLKDYILGNAGLNIKFKANEKKPLRVYAADFDDNGTFDVVLSKKYNGAYVPVRGRECSSQQMPFIKQKFPSYSSFASASLEEVYGEKLNESYTKEVTEFRSILLINRGDFTFDKIPLPKEAQMFPIMAIKSLDINKDGYEDLVLAGNIYETEVETPRLDAFSGLILLADKLEGYYPLSYLKTGLYIDGNIKDLQVISHNEKNILLFARNNNIPLAFELD